MSASDEWYVAVDEQSVGPVPTELVTRGIEQRRIPLEAQVCRVGSGVWASLASVEAFHAAVIQSYPPPPSGSEEARRWLEQGFRFPQSEPLPSFEDPTSEELPVASTRPAHTWSSPRSRWGETPHTPRPSRASANDIDVDIDLLEAPADVDVLDAPADFELVDAPTDVDWSRGFHGYFLIEDDVELPEEEALLESLSTASPATFRHEEALWNLALCLVFGSDAVGDAAARAFFTAVQTYGDVNRVAWMRRTLLDRGFVPVGIPAWAGQRALERLSRACPPVLAPKLLRDAA
jgi:hypothetical protein